MRPTLRFIDGNEVTEAPQQHVIVQCTYSSLTKKPTDSPCYTLAEFHALRFRLHSGEVSRIERTEGTDPAQFWAWLTLQLTPKRRTWVWSHEAHQQFMLLGGWKLCVNGALTVKWLLDKDPPWVLRGLVGSLRLTWVDLRNYFDLSLQELPEKLPRDCPWDFSSLLKNFSELPAEAMQLQFVACAVVALLRWHQGNDLGCFGWTSADIAMRAYRHNLGPRVIRGELSAAELRPEGKRKRPIVWPVPHDRTEVHEAERDAYYGPLFTMYHVGKVKGPIHVLDCQSHYASQMHGKFFPAQYLFSLSNPDLPKLTELASMFGTVAAVRLCSPDYAYPVRRNNRVGTAYGDFATWLAGPELFHALYHGHVTRCAECHVFRLQQLFTRFIDRFWNLRCAEKAAGNELLAKFCKDLLNKLTGKWSQEVDRWETDPKLPRAKDWGYKMVWDAKERKDVSRRYIGTTVQQKQGKCRPTYYFPAISAYITSYARLHMAHLISVAGPENVLYNPVDCLHVSQVGFDRLYDAGAILDGSLGKFRHERTIEKAEYLAPGVYVADGVPSAVGLPANREQVSETRFTYRRIERCCEVFASSPTDQLAEREESIDLGARVLWGKRGKGGQVFAPVLDDGESALQGLAKLPVNLKSAIAARQAAKESE